MSSPSTLTLSSSPIAISQPEPTFSSGFKRSPSNSKLFSPTPTLAVDSEAQKDQELAAAKPSRLRKNLLLALFALAQFIDIFSASAAVVSLPSIARDLGMTSSSSVWVINAYALTLASFLLTAGRIADIWSAKWTFIVGFSWVGIFSLGIGFVKTPIAMFVLRAISGIGAALTIPSALSLIVHLFPDPDEQAFAIGVFGGSGAIANVLGLLLGAVLLLASWHWVFWFIAIIALPLSVAAAFLIPKVNIEVIAVKEGLEPRKPKMDFLGTFLQTAAIVLVVYACTEANVKGWKTAGVITTLLIGFALFPAFAFWQMKIDARDALLLPSIWKIRNFTLLAVLSLTPYSWWFVVQVTFSEVFQNSWGESSILTAVRFLPIGVVGGITIIGTGSIPPHKLPLRLRLVVGAFLSAMGALILAFAHEQHDYARLMVPGFIIGTAGTGLLFVSTNISLMLSVPAEHAGVAGGVFNSALQLGTTIILSVATTIQIAYPSPEGLPSHKGYRSSFLFVMSVMLLAAFLALVLFEDPVKAIKTATESEKVQEDEKAREELA